MSSWSEERRLNAAAEAEQRRMDKAAEAERQAMLHEQAREDRRLELEARLQGQKVAAEEKRRADEAAAERKRLNAESDAERERRAAVEKRRQALADQRQADAEKAARKAGRVAKRAKLLRWLNANPVTLFVGYVMLASIIPAVISQTGALTGAGVFGLMALLLASMLEGGAWAIVFMGKQAEDQGRPTAKYRTAGWTTAAAAAGIQYWHWSGHAALWVACVFAASSIFAFFLWDLKTHGSHGKTREAKREEKARRDHLKKRRSNHKAVAKEADRLLSAVPFGTLSEEDAFGAAWRITYGTEPGMTPELYSRVTAARVELDAAFRIAEEERPTAIRAALLTGLLNPVPRALGNGLPVLGPSVPMAVPTRGSEAATSQAGIGLYASERPAVRGDVESPVGRSDEELERLLPDAHRAAAELVAEGKPLSAAGLSRKLRVRREDAVKLRDRVVGERRLHAVAAAENKRPGVSARVS